MNKQKSSGGQSKQSADESGNRGSEQGAGMGKSVKRGKDAASKPKSGGKGGGAKQKRKH
jgi:hypothetical protein